jgi:hypothetical protein
MKKIPLYLPQLTLASAMLCSLTAIAAPSISSAVKVDNEIIIYGAGFGSKSSAGPTFFQPFTDLAEDDTPDDAGFDSWVDRGGEVVTLLDGVGGGSLRADPELANNAFPHVGRYLPSGTQEVYLRFYFKLYQNATPPLIDGAQLKFARAGVSSGIGPVEDYYMAASKFSQSLYIGSANSLGENSVMFEWRDTEDTHTYYPEDTGGGGSGVATSELDTSTWVYAEVHYKLNDVGVANGIGRTTLNGFDWHNRTALEPRTSSGEDIDYIQPIPSIDLGQDDQLDDYDYAISRVYIDTGADSAAHVYLCNTSTAAACTKKFVLPPTAWTSGTDITVTAENIPSGYNWVYVTNAAGEVNSSGFAYTTPGC